MSGLQGYRPGHRAPPLSAKYFHFSQAFTKAQSRCSHLRPPATLLHQAHSPTNTRHSASPCSKRTLLTKDGCATPDTDQDAQNKHLASRLSRASRPLPVLFPLPGIPSRPSPTPSLVTRASQLTHHFLCEALPDPRVQVRCCSPRPSPTTAPTHGVRARQEVVERDGGSDRTAGLTP